MKTIAALQEELEKKKVRLKAFKNQVKSTNKKIKLKERELRDQARYAAGGIVLDPNFYNKYDGLLQDIFDNASTRDKKKFVKAGLIEADINRLNAINKSECKVSAKAAGEKETLSEQELSQLKQAIEKNVYQKVYGRKEELYVYTGPNEKLYISDNVSKYLLENEGFNV